MAKVIKVRKKTSPKLVSRTKRHFRIRKKVEGSETKPRLCVTKTNTSIYLQLIDDLNDKTLFSERTPTKKTATKEVAKNLGKTLAEKAVAKGIEQIVFDRGGFIFHGKVASVAEGAREGGLKF